MNVRSATRWIIPQDPSVLTRWVFLRSLGVIYLIAFASAAHQVDGLIGSRGILPIGPYLHAIDQHFGTRGRTLLPTLLWIDSSDRALHVLCGSGIALSVLLIGGVLPVASTLLLWALYLSLTTAGQTFFGFQWDALLLETGLLAVLYSPLQWMLWRAPRLKPPAVAVFLLRLLLFRLMFSSGLVKIASGDANWLHFSALRYHYWTQPLPPWTAWYFNRLPGWFQAVSVGFTFFAELIAPLLIFGPRVLRLIGFCTLVVLQVLIIITGNYGFFNLLAIALCFTLLEDRDWPVRWRKGFVARREKPRWAWPRRGLIGVAIVIVVLSVMRVVESVKAVNWPTPLAWLSESALRLDAVNNYGLFSEMTTSRIEIDVEGSNDGENWKSYAFRWKPGDVNRRPAFCVPDMPRLDWQMWFAALGDLRENLWFVNFLQRVLEGSPAVVGLMETNPFAEGPPRYVRAVRYEYRFTTATERNATGAWWHREEAGIYCPAISLRDFRE